MAPVPFADAADAYLVQLALDEIPAASVLAFDRSFRYVLVRGSAVAKHGYQPESMEGRFAGDALLPNRWQLYEPLYRAALAGAVTTSQVVSPDGSSTYLVRVSPLRDSAGNVVGGVSISTEITEEVAARAALERSEHRYRLLAENASDVVFQTDLSGVIVWVSPAVERVLGWAPEEFLGHQTPEFTHPEDRAEAIRRRAGVFQGASVQAFLFRIRCRSGEYRWVSVSAHPVRDEAGQIVAIVAGLRDVHDEQLARIRLLESVELFRTAMTSSVVGMALVEPDGRFRMANPALCRLLGRDEKWLLEHSADDIIHPDDLTLVLADRHALVSGAARELTTQMRLVRADGQTLWTRRSGALIRDPQGAPDCLVLQWEDMTAEHEANARLEFQAFHDPLTGLHNRAWILDMLEVDLRAARRSRTSVGVMFIDLDDFKLVNDSLGHAAGDRVLREVAHRIKSTLRPGDRVGRVGGDEFVAILTGVTGREQLEQVAERMVEVVSADLLVAEHIVVPGVSIGMAMSGADSDSRRLLRETDDALYRAKDAGRGCWRFYDESMHADSLSRLTLMEEIRAGLAASQFVAHFHPVLSLSDGLVQGYVASARWLHPSRGLLTQPQFLDSSDTNLESSVGGQVLDSALEQVAQCPQVRERISLKVSRADLMRSGWCRTLGLKLEVLSLPPERFILDVPEAGLAAMPEPVRSDLGSLARQGMGVHVDNFGTGFSSIPLMRGMPVTGVRLDPSLVTALTPQYSPANAIAGGLAGLAIGLGLRPIAGGIQSSYQVRVLREQGWQWGEGPLFGAAGPLADVVDQPSDHRAR